MVRVGMKAQKTILINHCLRVGKTDNLKRAAQIAREKGLIDQKIVSQKLDTQSYRCLILMNMFPLNRGKIIGPDKEPLH